MIQSGQGPYQMNENQSGMSQSLRAMVQPEQGVKKARTVQAIETDKKALKK